MNLDLHHEIGLTYVLRSKPSPSLPTEFCREYEMRNSVETYVFRSISEFDGENFLRFEVIADELFEMLVEAEVIIKKDAGIAGIYFRFEEKSFSGFRTTFLQSSNIHQLAREIGDRYYEDAFEAIERISQEEQSQSDSVEDRDDPQDGIDPSDRPNPSFFDTEANKTAFIAETERSLRAVDQAEIANSEKADARGYLIAAKALAETSEPPVDLIWTILNRANSLAGIASFFVGLISLIVLVTN